MELEIKRLDHLGIISGVINELGLIDAIDHRLQKDTTDQAHITPGEAIAGMIINGLGFSDRPLSLTPQFFMSKAVDELFREDVKAEHFNRHKLGKVLDTAYDYGCEHLFYELSTLVCQQEAIDLRFNSEDTTTFSLTGEYIDDTEDTEVIRITHGYSKDHRPDLKQVVQELLVSQDGGIPLMMKSWDGNASDNRIFEERANQLIDHFAQSEAPRYLIADSKLYTKTNAPTLSQLPFITRIPGSIKQENQLITEALTTQQWTAWDDTHRFYVKSCTHYDIEQRWIVVYSDGARARSEATLLRARDKEKVNIDKQLQKLSRKSYGCREDAEKALTELAKQAHFHQLSEQRIIEQARYESKGRPKKDSQPVAIDYVVTATAVADNALLTQKLDQKSCFVIATNADTADLSAKAIITAYKRQNTSIENTAFRFLKDPVFFASSLYLKKPSRIMGLLMVMTLALLVYSVAQRRLRSALTQHNETLPNQINQPTNTPTLRWIFQMMDGIHSVKMQVNNVIHKIVEGLTPLKKKIISFFGQTVMKIYGIEKSICREWG